MTENSGVNYPGGNLRAQDRVAQVRSLRLCTFALKRVDFVLLCQFSLSPLRVRIPLPLLPRPQTDG